MGLILRIKRVNTVNHFEQNPGTQQVHNKNSCYYYNYSVSKTPVLLITDDHDFSFTKQTGLSFHLKTFLDIHQLIFLNVKNLRGASFVPGSALCVWLTYFPQPPFAISILLIRALRPCKFHDFPNVILLVCEQKSSSSRAYLPNHCSIRTASL